MMFLRRFFLSFPLLAVVLPLMSQTGTQSLSVDDFASWHVLQNTWISHDGNWASWEVNDQQYGDGTLYFQALPEGDPLSFERGSDAVLSGDGQFLAFRVNAHFDSVRQAKLDELDDDEMPDDSLGIWLIQEQRLMNVPRLSSFQVPEDAGEWMAYQLEKAPEEADTTETEADSTARDSVSAPEPKEEPLILFHPASGESLEVASVSSYVVADSGRLIAMISVSGDTIDSVRVRVFDPLTRQVRTIYEAIGEVSDLTFDRSGKRLAFLASSDTSEVMIYNLYGYQYEEAQARKLVDTATSSMPGGWAVSEHGSLSFSRSGHRLFFGIAPAPMPEPEDSLLDSEKARLDVWTWNDPALQPEQLLDAEDERNRSYLSVWYWSEARMVQLETEELKQVYLPGHEDGPLAMGVDDRAYQIERSWAYPWKDDLYVVDVQSGESSLLLEGASFGGQLAPAGSYVVFWDGCTGMDES